jgi:hypothetical protein
MTAPTATAGVNSNSIAFTAPATGGKTITGFTVTGSDATTGSGAASPISIADTAGTSQTYTVVATNANGSGTASPASNNVTTLAPSFFSPPFFPPAFFSPPFFPPSFFSPPFFPPSFFFPPGFKKPPIVMCIGAKTKLFTELGQVAAEDIKVGDTLLTVSSKQLVSNENEEYSLLSNTVDFEKTIVTECTVGQENIVWFNNNKDKTFTLNQPIFIKTPNGIESTYIATLSVGDEVMTIDDSGNVSFVKIDLIDLSEDLNDVYTIRTSPNRWFIAGDYLVIS